jgi:uncharacterized integral membrane protein
MKARGVVYLLAGGLLAIFAIANWPLLIGSVELNLLVTRLQAPLALLLLLLAGVILLLDLTVHTLREYSWMRERRTLVRELEMARLRADKEEESRTGSIKLTVERELAFMRAQLDRMLAAQSALLDRTTRAEVVPDGDAIEPALIPPRRGRIPH